MNTEPNQPLLPTPRTDAAEKARQEYVSAIPDNLFSSLQDGQSEVGENWVKNAPPDGWSTARQLERELASRPAPPAPERELGEIAEHLGNQLAADIIDGKKIRSEVILQALTTATQPLREAHQKQSDNYIRLANAVIGEGTGTGDWKDPVEIANQLRSQVAKLTKERDDANTRELELSRQFNEMKHLRDRLQEQVRELMDSIEEAIQDITDWYQSRGIKPSGSLLDDCQNRLRTTLADARGEKEAGK